MLYQILSFPGIVVRAKTRRTFYEKYEKFMDERETRIVLLSSH